MSRTTDIDRLIAARAEALFASNLSKWSGPTAADVDTAIACAVRLFGGIRGCAGEVAAAYGEQPEIAQSRMQWALEVVRNTYARDRRPRPGHGPRTAADGDDRPGSHGEPPGSPVRRACRHLGVPGNRRAAAGDVAGADGVSGGKA